ncbi:MAG: hypothetical protein HZA54_04710 [Planctomycetes bacterium]|nr:hypothetical protein [Planctomycetota bacterium]
MDHLTCDLCGAPLLLDAPVRYQVSIQVASAYDPLELTAEDLARDHRAEIAAILRRLEETDPAAAQAEVYATFAFDLCRRCQLQYIQDPLRRAVLRRVVEPRAN